MSHSPLSLFSVAMLLALQRIMADSTPVSTTADPEWPDTDLETEHLNAVQRLSKVFGLNDSHRHVNDASPPPYMLDLYYSITDHKGFTKENPFSSTTVRSFQDTDIETENTFEFNLRTIAKDEVVRQAQLHLFKMRPSNRNQNYFYQMTLYHQLENNDNKTVIGKRIIGSHGSSWEVFSLNSIVNDWIRLGKGIVHVEIENLRRRSIRSNEKLRFAKKKDHAQRQPLLVVFTDAGEKTVGGEEKAVPKTRIPFKPPNPNFLAKNKLSAGNSPTNGSSDRKKRSTDSEGAVQFGADIAARHRKSVDDNQTKKQPSSSDLCKRHPLYIDFEKIGWSNWILSPSGYHAGHCKGECTFPLGQGKNPSNHATIQSIYHVLELNAEVGPPCCVPEKLYSISLLYFEDTTSVVLKQYDDMAVINCGCH